MKYWYSEAWKTQSLPIHWICWISIWWECGDFAQLHPKDCEFKARGLQFCGHSKQDSKNGQTADQPVLLRTYIQSLWNLHWTVLLLKMSAYWHKKKPLDPHRFFRSCSKILVRRRWPWQFRKPIENLRHFFGDPHLLHHSLAVKNCPRTLSWLSSLGPVWLGFYWHASFYQLNLRHSPRDIWMYCVLLHFWVITLRLAHRACETGDAGGFCAWRFHAEQRGGRVFASNVWHMGRS